MLLVALAALPGGRLRRRRRLHPRAPTAASRCSLDEYRVLPERVEDPRRARHPRGPQQPASLTHDLAVVQFDSPCCGDEEEKQYRPAPDQDAASPARARRPPVDLEPRKYRLVCTIANHDQTLGGKCAELKVVR